METTPLKKESLQIKSWDDLDYQISEIREKEIAVLSFQRNYDDAVVALQKRFMDPKQNLQDEVNFIKGKMKDFCDAHRNEMDDGKKKSLSNGEVYYRELPIKLKPLEDCTEDTIIKKIVKLGEKFVDKYLRTKTSLDMNTLKKEYTERKIDEKFLKSLGLTPDKGENFNVKANP